jgi:N-acetylmuramoyl-L-alanine amidase
MIHRRIGTAIILMLTMAPFWVFAKTKKISKIVIDAGHGGKDFGAHGAFSYEKDITLAVTLKLGKILNDSMKNTQVIYTRTEDTYPTLQYRHEIANKSNADIFVAIHVNSTPFTKTKQLEGYKNVRVHGRTVRKPIYKIIQHHVTKANGCETYVMGLSRTNQQKEAIDEFSEGVTDEGILDPNDPQSAIIIANYAQAFLKKSVTLGSKIQEQFYIQGRQDLGVKQKSLEVLAGSAMPGVLVEIGFITNTDEEAYLNSPKGQSEVAMAIYKGIKSYKEEIEKY